MTPGGTVTIGDILCFTNMQRGDWIVRTLVAADAGGLALLEGAGSDRMSTWRTKRPGLVRSFAFRGASAQVGPIHTKGNLMSNSHSPAGG